jgi:hypothetical protein
LGIALSSTALTKAIYGGILLERTNPDEQETAPSLS